MLDAKFSVDQTHLDFLNHYRQYGFKNRSMMVRTALEHLKADIEAARLRQSAKLYAELYAEESELRDLAEAAIREWPE